MTGATLTRLATLRDLGRLRSRVDVNAAAARERDAEYAERLADLEASVADLERAVARLARPQAQRRRRRTATPA